MSAVRDSGTNGHQPFGVVLHRRRWMDMQAPGRGSLPRNRGSIARPTRWPSPQLLPKRRPGSGQPQAQNRFCCSKRHKSAAAEGYADEGLVFRFRGRAAPRARAFCGVNEAQDKTCVSMSTERPGIALDYRPSRRASASSSDRAPKTASSGVRLHPGAARAAQLLRPP
jgi:hypothetical protein